jgi:hypothetical protein
LVSRNHRLRFTGVNGAHDRIDSVAQKGDIHEGAGTLLGEEGRDMIQYAVPAAFISIVAIAVIRLISHLSPRSAEHRYH